MEGTLLYRVFKKYCLVDQPEANTKITVYEYINPENFLKIIHKLKKIGANFAIIDEDLIQAIFMLYDKDCDHRLNYIEFEGWWNSETKQKDFTSPRSRLLKNARTIYLTASHGKPILNIEDLENYLQEKKIDYTEESVETIDSDGSGNISFREFGDWLKWF